jgi:type III pantothenate kinase
MAQALHNYTALLPLVEIRQPVPGLPATSTRAAMEAGIFWAVVGGINTLVDQLSTRSQTTPEVFITGGDGPLLQPSLKGSAILWPHMTLEGIRLTAEALA